MGRRFKESNLEESVGKVVSVIWVKYYEFVVSDIICEVVWFFFIVFKNIEKVNS